MAIGRVPARQDTAFPTQRVVFFTHPTQDDYERAKDKARELLISILPEKEREEFEERKIIRVIGKRGVYVLSAYGQTEIRDHKNGKIMAYACLQLSMPAPTYDRMVAEYILLKNAEDVYWQSANIFHRNGNEFGIAMLLLIAFDVTLFVTLFLEILRFS